MRAAWLAVPFTTGEVLATALHSYAPSFRTACAVGLWVLWGAAALAAMTLRPFALGFVRIWMPAGLAAAVWAVAARSVAEERLGETILGLAIAAIAAAASLMPSVGAAFTDQRVTSRPNTSVERRLLLRPPAATAFALTPLAWAATIAGSISGPLLLAAERWVLGAVVLVVGLAVAFRGYQSLLILARRWVVFVPAGIVLHDPLTLGDEAILLPKSGIKSLQIVSASTRRQEAALQEAAKARKNETATAGPTSTKADLCSGSLGTAIDLTLHEPARIPRLRQAPELATCVRFSPSSAHTFTEEALARSIVSGSRAYSGHGPAALAAEEIKGREKIPPKKDRP